MNKDGYGHKRTTNKKMFISSKTRKHIKNMSQHYWIVHFSSLIMFHFTQTIWCTIEENIKWMIIFHLFFFFWSTYTYLVSPYISYIYLIWIFLYLYLILFCIYFISFMFLVIIFFCHSLFISVFYFILLLLFLFSRLIYFCIYFFSFLSIKCNICISFFIRILHLR